MFMWCDNPTLMSGRCDSLRRRVFTASRCRDDYIHTHTRMHTKWTTWQTQCTDTAATSSKFNNRQLTLNFCTYRVTNFN